MSVTLSPAVTPSPAHRVMEFERSFREAAAAGNPPDALRRFTTDEVERFYAYVIPGLDDHSYWDGPKRFVRNDGKDRLPRRWVWERRHGPITRTTDVWPICGEKNCVTLEHLTAGRSAARLRYTDEQIIGRAQVVAMRLGHSPTSKWWNGNRIRPTHNVILQRFITWGRFLKAAGLDPPPYKSQSTDPESICEGLRALAQHLGRTPSSHEFRRESAWLRERGYPSAHSTVYTHFGSWNAGLKAAGLTPGARMVHPCP